MDLYNVAMISWHSTHVIQNKNYTNLFDNSDGCATSASSGRSAHAMDVGRQELWNVVRYDVVDGPVNIKKSFNIWEEGYTDAFENGPS